MIAFDHVSKTFTGGVKAVRDLTLEVNEGETLVLLGTSGSGKTTTMKMVNRLIEPSAGTIYIDGQNIMETNPIDLRRGIGYSIQHIGLFPHMTVGGNIRIVPNLLGWSEERIAERIDELLKLVGLEPNDFVDRYPNQLSGGQQQRIGVARALAADPPIVLMDEPFGALDPITRDQLQNEFLALESVIQKTIIFVTHDVFEAVKMGDRIAILDQGALQQVGTPRDIVEQPANEFVDEFLGQQRFQLSLLTQTVEPMVEPAEAGQAVEGERRGEYLQASMPLLSALDAFKRHGRQRLRVYKDGRLAGYLTKDALLAEITEVMSTLERETDA